MNWTQDNTAYKIKWTSNCTYDIKTKYTLKN